MSAKTSTSRRLTRRLSTIAAVSSLGMLAIGGTALAAVDYDPATGYGFVGKGDVQYTFGWNNDTLQKNASSVDFRYQATQDYEVTCEFDTEQGGKGGVKTIVPHVTHQELSTSVARDATTVTRKNPQGSVTGFNLSPEGAAVVVGGTLPAIGDECKSGVGNSFNDRITAVEPVGTATGGLLVKWGSVAYTPLLSPPVPVA